MRVTKSPGQAEFGGDCSANLVEILRKAGDGKFGKCKGGCA